MRKVLRIIFTVFLPLFFYGQSKEQLQRQNADLKKQIATINQTLAKTQSEAKLSVSYLNDVNKKIALREKVYNNTQKEKRLIEDDIYLRQLEINRQNKELGILRKNYAAVLVKAYKNKGVQNKVTFILSSKNLGEGLRRVQYLKQYADYQDRKAAEISDAAAKIKKSIVQRQVSMKSKEVLLVNQEKDLVTINEDREQKERVLADFKKNEVKLTAELRQKQAQNKVIEGKIRTIIAEEIKIAKAKEEAEKKAVAERLRIAKIAAEKEKARIEAENKAKIAAAAEAKRKADEEARKLREIANKKAAEEAEKAKLAEEADSKKLEDSRKAADAQRAEARRVIAAKEAADAADKARIAADKANAARATEAALNKNNEDAKKAAEAKTMTSFGITTNTVSFSANKGRISRPVEGQITHYFGRQAHAVFKNIVEENNGIKISTNAGAKAKCVFPGRVSKVFVTGETKTVMIKHGDYFTVYSNLENSYVTENQQVATGIPIGAIAQDFDGSYTLDFQIWNGSKPIDPLHWIAY